MTPTEIAEEVLTAARESNREQKRDDIEREIVPGVRVDPAPLTYKGASVEVDNPIPGENSHADIQTAIIQAYTDADDVVSFSTGTIYDSDPSYWYAALKDTERTTGTHIEQERVF